jgi:hypothetical protein
MLKRHSTILVRTRYPGSLSRNREGQKITKREEIAEEEKFFFFFEFVASTHFFSNIFPQSMRRNNRPWAPNNTILGSSVSYANGANGGPTADTPPKGAQKYTDPTSTESFSQYLQEAQRESAQQEQTLQEIAKAEKISTLVGLQTAKNVKTIREIEQIRFYMLILAILGTLFYLFGLYVSIAQRYKFMIDQVTKVKGFTKFRAWFIAFSYEHPIFTGFEYPPNFPAAVVRSYYSRQFRDLMVKNQDQNLPFMLQIARTGIKGQPSPLSAETIICAVFQDANVRECESVCPGPTKLGAADYVQSSVMMGAQGAFLGSIGLATILGGPAGTAVGALIGVGLGAGLTAIKENTFKKECEKIKGRDHCIPGVNAAC